MNLKTGNPDPRRPSWFGRHPRLARALIACGSFLLLDLAVSNVWKLVRTDPAAVERLYRVKSPRFHHTLRPSIAVEAFWGGRRYAVRTNSLGFKDKRVREVPAKPQGKRILFIGDSFTEGIGFPFEETWVGLVAEGLAPEGTEVLNAGVASYCPPIYFAKIKQLVEQDRLRFDELFVFIDVSDLLDSVLYSLTPEGTIEATDLKTNLDRSARRRLKFILRANFVVTSAIVELVRTLLRGPRSLNKRVARWTYDDAEFERHKGGVAVMREAMDRLLALCRKHSIRMGVAVYPWPDQILHRDLDSRQVRIWKEWCAANKVGFQDLFPEFIDSRDPQEVIDRYFIPGDVHHNAAGHALMAKAFLRDYRSR